MSAKTKGVKVEAKVLSPYEEWVASLKEDTGSCRCFFIDKSYDDNPCYRHSMGERMSYNMEDPPSMTRCNVTGNKVWQGECAWLWRNGEYVWVSRAGQVMGGRNGQSHIVNAYCPKGRSVKMMFRDTVKVNGATWDKNAVGGLIVECPKTKKLVSKEEMTEFEGELVSNEYLENLRNELVIRQHDWRPPSFSIPDGSEYCGIELEVECKDSDRGMSYLLSARYLREEIGDISFMKYDGSLGYGYEIVTHPITWETIKSRISPVLDKLSKFGLRSHEPNTCGLHVHLPKKHLSRLDISKMVVLWNSDEDWVAKVSGRGANRYCEMSPKKHRSLGGPLAIRHYASINTSNFDTVEFRSYRGTLNKQTFLGRIGLCFLVRSYVKQCGTNVNWNDFIQWLCSQPFERKRFKESWSLIADVISDHKCPKVITDETREEVGRLLSKKAPEGGVVTMQPRLDPSCNQGPTRRETEAQQPLRGTFLEEL